MDEFGSAESLGLFSIQVGEEASDADAFPLDASEWQDSDSDGQGNNADTDDDNDGVEDSLDAFPFDEHESVDTDSDGVGNNADTDDDNDGFPDFALFYAINVSIDDVVSRGPAIYGFGCK